MISDKFNNKETQFIANTVLEFIKSKDINLDFTLLIYDTTKEPTQILEFTSASDTHSKIASLMNGGVKILNGETVELGKC